MNGLLKIDGHNNAIRGVVRKFGSNDTLCYDMDQVIENLVDNGMELMEAHDFFEYNIMGAFVGETTPVFIYDYEGDESYE